MMKLLIFLFLFSLYYPVIAKKSCANILPILVKAKARKKIFIPPFLDTSTNKTDEGIYSRLAISAEIISVISSNLYDSNFSTIEKDVMLNSLKMDQLLGGVHEQKNEQLFSTFQSKIDFILRGEYKKKGNKIYLSAVLIRPQSKKVYCNFADFRFPFHDRKKQISVYAIKIAKEFIPELKANPEVIEYEKKYAAFYEDKIKAEEKLQKLEKKIDNIKGPFKVTTETLNQLESIDSPDHLLQKLNHRQIKGKLIRTNNRFQKLILRKVSKDLFDDYKAPIIVYSIYRKKENLEEKKLNFLNAELNTIEIRGFNAYSDGENDHRVKVWLNFHWKKLKTIIKEQLLKSDNLKLYIYGHLASDNDNTPDEIDKDKDRYNGLAFRRASLVRRLILLKWKKEKLKSKIENLIIASKIAGVRNNNIPDFDNANQRVTFKIK